MSPSGRDHALDNNGEQAHQQQRREHLAYNVHHGGLLDAQGQDHREEHHGEHHRRYAGQVGRDGHLISAGAGAGDGHHGADTQNDGAHEDLGGDSARPFQYLLAAAHAEQGEHTHHRQTDIRNEIGGKARQPLLPASMPKKGGKITLPAPKNMENSAKPTTTISAAVFFLCPIILISPFLFSCSHAADCGAPVHAHVLKRVASCAYSVSCFSSLRK